MAQISKEAITLSNSLPDLWYNGEVDKAIENSFELYKLYEPSFIENIHNSLAQQIQNDIQLFGYNYLEQLIHKKNNKLNSIIYPIYLWSKSVNTTKSDSLKNILEDLNSMLTDNSSYEARTERYSILILQELDKKKAVDEKSKEKILQKNIKNLETYLLTNNFNSDKLASEKRAWYRYILAYSYKYLYTIKLDNEVYLKKASDFSPNILDIKHKNAFFYDAALITGNVEMFEFHSEYKKHLIDNGRNDEALELTTKIAFENPTNENLESLRNYYKKSNKTEQFNDYWKNYFNKKGKAIPKIKILFENDVLNLSDKIENWLYIDVWGTWCSPCLKELPELQRFFIENNNNNNNLKIYTLSYDSNNLKEFLNKNNYTFPVSEIDKQTNQLLDIISYPTKFLVSPEGKYVEIPFGVDWKIFIKNYMLL